MHDLGNVEKYSFFGKRVRSGNYWGVTSQDALNIAAWVDYAEQVMRNACEEFQEVRLDRLVGAAVPLAAPCMKLGEHLAEQLSQIPRCKCYSSDHVGTHSDVLSYPM